MKYLNMLAAKESEALVNTPTGEAGEAFIVADDDTKVSQIQSEVLADDIETIKACESLLASAKPEDAKAVKFASERIMAIGSRYGIPVQNFAAEGLFGVASSQSKKTESLRQSSKTILAALEPAKERIDANLVIAKEGAVGALLGLFAGMASSTFVPIIGGAAAGMVMRSEADKLKDQIELIGKDIEKLRREGSKKALGDGEITKDVYEAQVSVSSQAIIEGAILGLFFSGIYGAVQGHKIEERHKEMKAKLRELNALMAKGGKTSEGKATAAKKTAVKVDKK